MNKPRQFFKIRKFLQFVFQFADFPRVDCGFGNLVNVIVQYFKPFFPFLLGFQ